jgi:predicted kinase
VSRLILINGLPGSGKSTLARRYAQDHPLTLVLDIDVVRGLLSAWMQDPPQSGLLARDLALTMA